MNRWALPFITHPPSSLLYGGVCVNKTGCLWFRQACSDTVSLDTPCSCNYALSSLIPLHYQRMILLPLPSLYVCLSPHHQVSGSFCWLINSCRYAFFWPLAYSSYALSWQIITMVTPLQTNTSLWLRLSLISLLWRWTFFLVESPPCWRLAINKLNTRDTRISQEKIAHSFCFKSSKTRLKLIKDFVVRYIISYWNGFNASRKLI